MSAQPWGRGPLDDALTELGALLADYAETPEGQRYAEARLREFAQANLRGQRWVRELGPWQERSDGRSWHRRELDTHSIEFTAWERGGLWYYQGPKRRGPYESCLEALRAADAEASLSWLFDPALPPVLDAVAEDDGPRAEGRGRMCTTCGGSGTERYRPENGWNYEERECLTCNGSGRVPETRTEPEGQRRQREARPFERGESRPLDGSPPSYAFHAWSSTTDLLTDGDWQRCTRCGVSRRRAWNLKRRKEELTYWRDGQRLRTAGRCEPAWAGEGT